jgi:hypothetical protein
MNRFYLSKRTFLLATLLSLVLLTAQMASAAPVKEETWRIVKSPNGSLKNSELFGMAAISEHDVWAVGITYTSKVQALIEHWNGSQWSIVPSPNPANGHDLNAVAAVSANDIWAVGSTGQFGTPTRTLIEHWNGSQWSVVPSPNPGPTQNLFGAVAIAQNNVWAVGFYGTSNGSITKTLVLHWNGSQWSVIPSPNSGSNTLFNSVAAVSADDIWAVGNAGSATLPQTLVEHWNGSRWRIVPSPNVGPNGDFLIGVTVVSERNIWTAGAYNDKSNILHTLIEHWNGTSWSVVNSPNVGPYGSLLDGVSALSASNIWAVGFDTTSSNQQQTLIEHWNGTKWSVVTSPNIGSGGDGFNTVVAVSADDIWAIGNFINAKNLSRILIEHCC